MLNIKLSGQLAPEMSSYSYDLVSWGEGADCGRNLRLSYANHIVHSEEIKLTTTYPYYYIFHA
ncbi:hypothetical protein C0J52_00057 [Blattella germanica]|nr:hypothetical protein C0J52_00057 [Blattella germanica]